MLHVKKIKKTLVVLYFALCFCFLFSVSASAYVDPATTSMLVQIIAGVFISLGVAFGIFRTKIILFFNNLKMKLMQKKLEMEAAKRENQH